MFEAVELGRTVDKEWYEQEASELRVRLQQLQYEFRGRDFPVIVVLSGNDRLGLGEAMHTINEWADPRSLETNAFGSRSEEERERPNFWRYWHVLPPAGRIGVFFGGWTHFALMDRAQGLTKKAAHGRLLEHIRNFERMLVHGGALLVKLWLHVSDDELERRLEGAEKRARGSWRIHEKEWSMLEDYDEFLEHAEEAIRETSTEEAPWEIIESDDSRYRNLTVVRSLTDALARRLEEEPSRLVQAPLTEQAPAEEAVLGQVDLSLHLDKKEYVKLLDRWQEKLHKLSQKAREQGVTSVLVFEGWDAAGKGGVIRRLSAALDPPTYRVIPIGVPTDEENAHHYLWRFWRHLPRAGRTVIFDRSWYGRVLVERVEGFATETEWHRAYREINDFEALLCESGTIVVKFWLHLDPEEQLRRFKAREDTPFKKYKITDEDYRNRERWPDYERAVREMVARTSTEHAPWELIPANDKRYARIEVIRTVCRYLKKAL